MPRGFVGLGVPIRRPSGSSCSSVCSDDTCHGRRYKDELDKMQIKYLQTKLEGEKEKVGLRKLEALLSEKLDQKQGVAAATTDEVNAAIMRQLHEARRKHEDLIDRIDEMKRRRRHRSHSSSSCCSSDRRSPRRTSEVIREIPVIVPQVVQSPMQQAEPQTPVDDGYEPISRRRAAGRPRFPRGASPMEYENEEPVQYSSEPKDRFQQYMDMMLIQQSQAQNMIVNQMLVKHSGPGYAPYPGCAPPAAVYAEPYACYPPPAPAPHHCHHHHRHHHGGHCHHDHHDHDHDHHHHHRERKEETPKATERPPPPKTPVKESPKKKTDANYKYPGNAEQRIIRRLGYAAMFCMLLDKRAKMEHFRPKDEFSFPIKLREIIAALHKIYLAREGTIYPILKQYVVGESAYSYKIMQEPSKLTAHIKKLAARDLSFVLENLTYQITKIMPATGILGTHKKSAVFDMIKHGQKFPDDYLLKIDKEIIIVDKDNRTEHVDDTQAQFLILGIFFMRALVATLLLKPRQFGLIRAHSIKIDENLRILASLYGFLYRSLLSRLQERQVLERKKAVGVVVEFPEEYKYLLISDDELDPILRKVKKSFDYAQDIILQWSAEYVRRVKGASF